MITRIVKMTFQKDKIEDFKAYTDEIQGKILSFEGCTHLDIYEDIHRPEIFFSYSLWESEEDLENYRNSGFFQVTWGKISAWFSAKTRAWSLEKL